MLTVENDRGSSNTVHIPVREATPGIFTIDDLRPGQGMVVAHETDKLASLPSPVAKASPARPGDLVSLFVTGLGVTASAVDGALQDNAGLRSHILLLIDGIPAEVLSAGPLPGLPGIYRVDARIPRATAPSAQVPVEIRVALTDGRLAVSNEVTISVENQ
jgi:uncharacterized protein (TIGR03437 family)